MCYCCSLIIKFCIFVVFNVNNHKQSLIYITCYCYYFLKCYDCKLSNNDSEVFVNFKEVQSVIRTWWEGDRTEMRCQRRKLMSTKEALQYYAGHSSLVLRHQQLRPFKRANSMICSLWVGLAVDCSLHMTGGPMKNSHVQFLSFLTLLLFLYFGGNLPWLFFTTHYYIIFCIAWVHLHCVLCLVMEANWNSSCHCQVNWDLIWTLAYFVFALLCCLPLLFSIQC